MEERKYVTGSDILKGLLKEKVIAAGKDEVFRFTGVYVKTADDKEVDRIMDVRLSHMSKEMLYGELEKYGLMPRCIYSVPEKDAKYDGKTPTGSIKITHPVVDMTCHVTDDPALPGFIITCKDKAGTPCEFHIYLSPAEGMSIRLCTSIDTNRRLAESDIVRRNFTLPFDCEHVCAACASRDRKGVCRNRESAVCGCVVPERGACGLWR